MATGLTASVPTGNRARQALIRGRRARVETNLTVNAKTGNRARAALTQPGRRARVATGLTASAKIISRARVVPIQADRRARVETNLTVNAKTGNRARAALTQPGRRARVGTGLTASAKTINRARVVPIQPDLPVQEVTNHRRLVISATAAGSPAIQKLAAATKGGGITAREPQGKTAALRAKTQAAVTAVIPTQASAGEN